MNMKAVLRSVFWGARCVLCVILALLLGGCLLLGCASQSVDTPSKGTSRRGEWSNWVDLSVSENEVGANGVLVVPVTITTEEVSHDKLERTGAGPVGTEQRQDIEGAAELPGGS